MEMLYVHGSDIQDCGTWMHVGVWIEMLYIYVHSSDIYRIVRTWIHEGVWMEMLYVHGSDTYMYTRL